MIATKEIKRPALRYYGGKWRLAPWIISHFPEHKNYVEPCGGAASVLLQKPRSPLETYNDLDGDVVNFFQVLRDNTDELLRAIRLTPWSRREFELSWSPAGEAVEDARRFFIYCWMSMSGAANGKSGNTWKTVKFDKNYTRRLYFDDLFRIADRFLDVQIECAPATEVIKRYDHLEALIYFDPPYLKSERGHKNEYTVEAGDDFHIEAARLLSQVESFVIVSGYACPLYADLYEAHGWQRFDKEAQTNSGGKRIESIWLSPRTWKALQAERGPNAKQLEIFGDLQP